MKKFLRFLGRPSILVAVAAGAYGLLFAAISLWKLQHFLYDNLDLANFNNVFFNTLQGSWFASSIHPPTYLADHFSPFLLALLPIYALRPAAETLLLIQTAAIALSVWPLYLISKQVIQNRWWAIVPSILWLLNPLVHNLNTFEFHFITYGVFFLLWAFYWYQQK